MSSWRRRSIQSAYAAAISAEKLVGYSIRDTSASMTRVCMLLAGGKPSTLKRPARNFAWDHAVASGSERHWIIDDNINGFARMFKSRRIPARARRNDVRFALRILYHAILNIAIA